MRIEYGGRQRIKFGEIGGPTMAGSDVEEYF